MNGRLSFLKLPVLSEASGKDGGERRIPMMTHDMSEAHKLDDCSGSPHPVFFHLFF